MSIPPIPPASPSRFRNFRELIRWLAITYHGGRYYPMAKHIGVGSATIDQWKHGIIRQPRLDSLAKLAAAYALNLDELIRLVMSPPSRRGGRD